MKTRIQFISVIALTLLSFMSTSAFSQEQFRYGTNNKGHYIGVIFGSLKDESFIAKKIYELIYELENSWRCCGIDGNGVQRHFSENVLPHSGTEKRPASTIVFGYDEEGIRSREFEPLADSETRNEEYELELVGLHQLKIDKNEGRLLISFSGGSAHALYRILDISSKRSVTRSSQDDLKVLSLIDSSLKCVKRGGSFGLGGSTYSCSFQATSQDKLPEQKNSI